MKKILLIGLGIWFFYLLQTSVFINFEFAGIVPNFMLIFTTLIGLLYGKKYGLTVGFISGLIIDIFSFSIIGIYALIYMLIGYANGCFSKIFFPEDIKLPIILIIISNFTLNFTIYVLMFLLRGRLDLGYYLINVIIPEMVYTVVITLFAYPILLLVQNKKHKSESKKETFNNID